jgi:trehalose 6-phosphate synthase
VGRSEHAAPLLSGMGSAANNGKLIVVSNRVVAPDQVQAGGLAQALASLLRRRGGTWMGWSGGLSANTSPRWRDEGSVRYVTWDLARRDFDAYYRDYSNRTLWPLLHGRTDLMEFRRSALQGYLRVNERFADVVARTAGNNDLVWVHDYHLIPLASLLRARGLTCRIGFFLHTPLPAPHTLVTLPQHRAMLGLLAAYDVVGVQTEADKRALCSYLMGELGATDEGDHLQVPGAGRMSVGTFPIGIDPVVMGRLADASAEANETQELRRSLADRQLMVGVDRLDYSKGLPQRLRAFGLLLERQPELLGRATYLQVAPESRRDVIEYRRLSREVQRLVGDINGHHATPDWTPVRYVNRGYPHTVLAGFYRMARVCAVTPLRDGMNLVAKEFIACQTEADPGVLVLSEFAGAAAQLGDVALVVNPFDVEGTARAFGRAFGMPLEERRERWREGMRVLQESDVHHWCDGFLAALQRVPRPSALRPDPVAGSDALRWPPGGQPPGRFVA